MVDKILTADEAEALKARIGRLCNAEPVRDIGQADASLRSWLKEQVGRAGLRLPADQWFALCRDALRTILPDHSVARQEFEELARSIESNGDTDVSRIMQNEKEIKALLRMAETTADLYTGTSKPEDFDLRVREAIRHHVWHSWPVRGALAAIFILVGGTAFWGITGVEGLKVDLRKEMSAAEDALRAEIKSMTDETDGVIAKASEDLQAFKDEMTGIKGGAKTELADFRQELTDARTDLVNARSDLAEKMGQMTDRITGSSEQVATLYAQVRTDLQGLDDRTRTSFEQALRDKTSSFNEDLKQLGRQVQDLMRVAVKTDNDLKTLGERTDSFNRTLDNRNQTLNGYGERVRAVDVGIQSLEQQEREVAERMGSLLSLYRDALDLGRANLSELNDLLSGIKTFKEESQTMYDDISTTKVNFDTEVETVRAGIAAAKELVETFEGSKQGLEGSMSSFYRAHGTATARLTALTSDRLSPLETRAGELEGQLRSLEERYKLIGELVQALANQIAGSSSSMAESSASIRQTAANASKLDADVATAQRSLEAGQANIRKLSDRAVAVEGELAALENTRDSLKPGYEQLLGQLAEAVGRTQEALASTTPLIGEIGEARSNVGDLLSQSSSDRQSIAELVEDVTAEHTNMTERWSGLDQALVTKQTELTERWSALDQGLTTKQTELTGHWSGLDQDLTTKQTELTGHWSGLDQDLTTKQTELTERWSALDQGFTTKQTELTGHWSGLDQDLTTKQTELTERWSALDQGLATKQTELTGHWSGLDQGLATKQTELTERWSGLDQGLATKQTELTEEWSELETQRAQIAERLSSLKSQLLPESEVSPPGAGPEQR